MAGPWRTTGDWWRADTWARDEWDVAIEVQGSVGSGQWAEADGLESKEIGRHIQGLYRIYRELRTGAWFVEGVYD